MKHYLKLRLLERFPMINQLILVHTDVKSMRRLVDVLSRAFPIRNCYVELDDKSVIKKGLGLVRITQKEYQEMIDHMVLFLKGNTKSVEKN